MKRIYWKQVLRTVLQLQFIYKKKDNIIRPVAYFSKKLFPQQINYEIYDKELLTIDLAFEEWKQKLEGSVSKVTVLNNYKNLQYFIITKNLNRRQARWAEYLSRFNFKIYYRPGRCSAKPDALTRRSGDLPREGDLRIEQQKQVLLKPKMLATPTLKLQPLETEDVEPETEDILATIVIKQAEDELIQEILKLLRSVAKHLKKNF